MPIDRDLLLVLKSEGIGDSEPDLGARLMKAFLTTLYDTGRFPAKIILLNSGVFLTTEGSPVIGILSKFADEGSELLSCGTCLEYYDRANKLVVGRPTNMKETVDALQTFSNVISM